MTVSMYVVGGGAVTPVGLDVRQTCAGIRARVSRFEEVLRTTPFGKPQVVARIPAHWSLRQTSSEWLINLATRAVREVIARHGLDPQATALIVIPPEVFRQPAFDDPESLGTLGESIVAKLGVRFESLWQVAEGGAASLAAALRRAALCFDTGRVKHVILGGVDSYVLDVEYARLDTAGRLRTEGTAQGLTPGEAAAFLLLSRDAIAQKNATVAILGWGDAEEPVTALSDRYSQGRGMLDALRAAASRSGVEESAIDWVISNANGERYASWESLLARTRFYRTRREVLPTTYPAMFVGEAGSASGALALLVAAHAFERGYCPGHTVMIQISSEGERRAACLVVGGKAAR
jgi:3-oxoacyl-[acyl-carrier-protein] synthase-1